MYTVGPNKHLHNQLHAAQQMVFGSIMPTIPSVHPPLNPNIGKDNLAPGH